jgi:heme O synthase-like polyprenyltransferase
MAATKNHDYHLVEPDPWPLIGAFSALVLFSGAVMWMHDNPYGKFVFAAGVAAALSAAFIVLSLPVLANRATEPAGMAPEKRLFGFSVLYLFALFAVLVADRWLLA